MDLVGTCPKGFWDKWLAEGDCAGDPASDTSYSWKTRSKLALTIRPGERFYVVAHGKLRGYAEVYEVFHGHPDGWTFIYRWNEAIACTIPLPIPGFQGLRRRWWDRSQEIPFPSWKTP